MPASSTSGQGTAFVPSDQDLLDAYGRRGDEQAFAALVGRHLSMVLGTARRRTGDPHVAEEVAQTTFSILARKAASLPRIESLGAWLHRVALLQSIRAMRHLARHRRKLERAMHNADSFTRCDTADVFEEALPWIDQALDELCESDRQLLILRYYERLSFADIATRVGRSEVALRQQAGRAVERLSGRLRRRGIVVPAAALTASLGASLAGPQASGASIMTLTRGALATAPAIPGATLWITSLVTMSTPKAITLAAAAAIALTSIPLGWQFLETNRLKAELDAATAARGRPSTARPRALSGPVRPSPPPAAAIASPRVSPAADEVKSVAEKAPEPMDEMLRLFLRRKAEAEADRAALSLGLEAEQTERYRVFLESRYRQRADAGSDEDRARLRLEDRQKREEFIASLIGPDGRDRYRAAQQRRDEAALEKASGDALHSIARVIDLTEEQKGALFQALFGCGPRGCGRGASRFLQLRLWVRHRGATAAHGGFINLRIDPNARTVDTLAASWSARPGHRAQGARTCRPNGRRQPGHLEAGERGVRSRGGTDQSSMKRNIVPAAAAMTCVFALAGVLYVNQRRAQQVLRLERESLGRQVDSVRRQRFEPPQPPAPAAMAKAPI